VALVAKIIGDARIPSYDGGMNLWMYLLVVNALTFVLYWHDKRSARHQAVRVPEYLLLLLGLLGGTLAALVAQRTLRHKTRKRSFQLKFWGLTAVQIGLLCFPPEILRLVVLRVFR